jgi:hypothetical protein
MRIQTFYNWAVGFMMLYCLSEAFFCMFLMTNWGHDFVTNYSFNYSLLPQMLFIPYIFMIVALIHGFIHEYRLWNKYKLDVKSGEWFKPKRSDTK